jgi:hypothetical protein
MRLMLAVAAALLLAPAGAAAQDGPPVAPGTRSVLFVANNWDGTADIVDPQTFAKLGRINVIPDLQERLQEKALDPRKLGYFLAVRALIGEGNDQYADDMFSSHDGRFVYISRPSMADVVAIEIATGRIAWRFPTGAIAPTTWRSPPTAAGCSSRTRPRARCTRSTRPRA